MTANATHAGHASQSAFAIRERTSPNMTTPTMKASMACRLGIAAYGFEPRGDHPAVVAHRGVLRDVSTKPHSGNMRGGAVGIST